MRSQSNLRDSRARQEHVMDGLLRFLGVPRQTGNPDKPIRVKDAAGVTSLFDQDAKRQARRYDDFKRRNPNLIRD